MHSIRGSLCQLFCQLLLRKREREMYIKKADVQPISILFLFFSHRNSRLKTQGTKLNSSYGLWQVYFIILNHLLLLIHLLVCKIDCILSWSSLCGECRLGCIQVGLLKKWAFSSSEGCFHITCCPECAAARVPRYSNFGAYL